MPHKLLPRWSRRRWVVLILAAGLAAWAGWSLVFDRAVLRADGQVVTLRRGLPAGSGQVTAAADFHAIGTTEFTSARQRPTAAALYGSQRGAFLAVTVAKPRPDGMDRISLYGAGDEQVALGDGETTFRAGTRCLAGGAQLPAGLNQAGPPLAPALAEARSFLVRSYRAVEPGGAAGVTITYMEANRPCADDGELAGDIDRAALARRARAAFDVTTP